LTDSNLAKIVWEKAGLVAASSAIIPAKNMDKHTLETIEGHLE
jgi:hypothetical protein